MSSPLPTSFLRPRRAGFTLIELLTVIAIIGILAAIIIPTVGRVRSSARQAQCGSNMRQMAMAMRMWAQDSKTNNLPPGGSDATAQGLSAWYVSIAPYLNIPDGTLGPAPKLRAAGVQICPSFEEKAVRATAYGINVYMMSNTFYQWKYRLSVVPSPSKIIMLGEKNGNVDQVDPRTATSLAYPELRHSDGANWAFIDGHVEYVKGQIPADDPRWKWWP